jgi:hypothetical protein
VARDPALAILSYPLLLTYGIVLNTRRAPFDELAARRRIDAAVLGITGDAGLAYLGPLAELAGMHAPPDAAAAQRMFADSLPVVSLYHARGLQGMNRRVQGVTMDLRGELPTVHDWWAAR